MEWTWTFSRSGYGIKSLSLKVILFQLVIGNPGITEGMSRVQLSVWSIWSAPLIMSNDLRNIRPEFRSILQNTRVINIDQDPMGRFGRMVLRVSNHFI
jgi:hypothetical protein